MKIIPLVMEELKSYKLKDEFAKPFEEKIIEEKKLLTERNTEKRKRPDNYSEMTKAQRYTWRKRNEDRNN